MKLHCSKQTIFDTGKQVQQVQQQQQQQPAQSKTQKGWLSRRTRNQWSRHWFVLRNGSLTYYRGPAAELCSFLDGVLDLSLIKHMELEPEAPFAAPAALASQQHPVQAHQFAGQQSVPQATSHFAFSLRMWNGECHLFSANSDAERALWLAAIKECAAPDSAVGSGGGSGGGSSSSSSSSCSAAPDDDDDDDEEEDLNLDSASSSLSEELDEAKPLAPARALEQRVDLDQLTFSIKTAIRKQQQQRQLQQQQQQASAAAARSKFLADEQLAQRKPAEVAENPTKREAAGMSWSSSQRAQLGSEQRCKLQSSLAGGEQNFRYTLRQHFRSQPTANALRLEKERRTASGGQDDDEDDRDHDDEVDNEADDDDDDEMDDDDSSSSSSGDESAQEELASDDGAGKDEPEVSGVCKDNRRRQKKRVSFDLSVSSLRQLTSASSADSSSPEADSASDSSLESSDEGSLEAPSSSPSSSSSSACEDAEQPEVAACSTRQRAARDEPSSPQPPALPPETTARVKRPEAETRARGEPAQQVELRQLLEKAERKASGLEEELNSSYLSYAQLELACRRLRSNLANSEEQKKLEVLVLRSQVEELTRSLAESQRQLREAHDKLHRLEPEAGEQQRLAAAKTGPPVACSGKSLALSRATCAGPQLLGPRHQPLLLMHHVRDMLLSNKQLLGAKLLSQSKQIQRKLNELELKVDKIQLGNKVQNQA